MPSAAANPDVFTAVADGRRREILDLLAQRERSVNEVVKSLELPQPQVSKHLRVLREVGLVNVREAGRLRVYSLSGEPLRPVFDWVRTYERFWDHQLDRIQQRAERMANQRPVAETPPPSQSE